MESGLEEGLPPLLEEVVLLLTLPDLDEVVFPPPPRLVDVDSALVRLLPDLRPARRSQRHSRRELAAAVAVVLVAISSTSRSL